MFNSILLELTACFIFFSRNNLIIRLIMIIIIVTIIILIIIIIVIIIIIMQLTYGNNIYKRLLRIKKINYRIDTYT